MAYIRFYTPYYSANRDENRNDAYERLSNFFTSSNCGYYQGSFPAANISETDKEFRIEMALPGVDKKNISIKHEKGYLSISIDKAAENNENELYNLREFDYSASTRTFKLNDKIEAEKIAARYENGILALILPKKEAFVKKPVQAITVE
jgi:HSP20 family protein